MLAVRKHDGSIETFNKSKIIESIRKETGCEGVVVNKVVDEVEYLLSVSPLQVITGPLIREVVNAKFLEYELFECQKKYTRVGMPLYDARKIDLGGGKGDNANLQDSPETGHKRKADQLSKEQYILTFPSHIAEAHLNGDIHIHDLEYFGSRQFCLDSDLRYFFYYGFVGDGTGQHTSYAAPANRPEVAILHAVKVLGSSQTNCAGGQGFYNFLTFIAPYFENQPYDVYRQCMQMFCYEMTQMLVARGGQVVFSSVQLSPGIPELWKKIPVVYKGKIWDGQQAQLRTYGEFELENRLLFKALMEVMIEGDYNGKPFYFPKPEISIEPQFIKQMEYEDDHDIPVGYPTIRELYLLSFELASKFGTPYFDNQIPQYRGAGKGISCFQCIPEGEIVCIKSDNGIKLVKIEDVVEADLLLSSKFTPFQGMLKQSYDGKILEIKLDSGRIIKCTKNHIINGIEARFLNVGDVIKLNATLPLNETNFNLFYNGIIQCVNGKTPSPEEISYLIGTIVAEGNILIRDSKIGGTRLQISFGITSQEVEYAHKIENILIRCGYIAKLQLYKSETRIVVYSTSLCKFLSNNGVPEKTARGGKVPDFIFTATDSVKFAFLYGYFRGDGSFGFLNGKFPKISMQTGSRDLQLGCQMLFESLGIHSCGYYISSRDIYTIDINKKEHISNFFSGINTGITTRDIKITAINEIDYSGNVYDPVDVEDNHEFRLGNGLVIGNCCSYCFSSNEESDDSFNDKLYFRDGAHFSMGSYQVMTVNFPRIAYEAINGPHTSEPESYFETLAFQRIDLCCEVFKMKREMLKHVKAPFLQQIHEGSQLVDFKNLVYTIGVIGINEVCEILYGKSLHESPEVQIKAMMFIMKMKRYCAEKSKELGFTIAFARTPAETTAQRFAVLDLLNYGDAHKFVKGDVRAAIKQYAETGSRDLPIYYTNGTHCRVDANIQIAEKIRIEQAFFPILDGGNICNIYLGEMRPDPRGLMDMTFRICKSTNLGYFAFTRDFTVCNYGYKYY